MRTRTQSIDESSALQFTQRDKINYLITTVAALLTLFTARVLDPSPEGVGTHQQLGLPPCPFLHFTGLPCPTCGFTTCFAYGMRLHLYEAILIQPFGFLIFCMTVAWIPTSVFLLARRVSSARIIGLRGRILMIYIMIALCLLGWFYKIVVMKSLFASS